MNKIAEELDRKLQHLEPHLAASLESIVRSAIAKFDERSETAQWPEGYFEEVLGALQNEPFERAPQGELPERESW